MREEKLVVAFENLLKKVQDEHPGLAEAISVFREAEKQYMAARKVMDAMRPLVVVHSVATTERWVANGNVSRATY